MQPHPPHRHSAPPGDTAPAPTTAGGGWLSRESRGWSSAPSDARIAPGEQESFPRLRAALLVGTFGTVLIPGNWAYAYAYPALLGIPLLVSAVRSRGDPDFRLWCTFILGFVLFVVLRRTADDVGVPALYSYVIAADHGLGAGTVPTVRLQALLYDPAVPGWLEDLAIGTHLSYYVASLLVAVLVWAFRPRWFPRYMLALTGAYLLGLVLHFLLPTAPPWMAAQQGHIPHVHRIIYDVVYHAHPTLYEYGYSVASSNDVAAMPSMHMAATWAVALVLLRVGRVAGAAGLLYAATMAFSLTYLGEHYLVDVLAGMAVTTLTWITAGALLRRYGVGVETQRA